MIVLIVFNSDPDCEDIHSVLQKKNFIFRIISNKSLRPSIFAEKCSMPFLYIKVITNHSPIKL